MLTTLGSNDTAVLESVMEELEVRLLKKALCWSVWVTAIGDNDVELVLPVGQELEAIANVRLDVRVLVANGHTGQVLLAQTDDGLVDVAEDGLLNALVLDDLTEDTTVTTTDDKDLLGVGVRVHGEVGDHLLVGEFVALCALDDVVENEHHAVVGGLEDKDILVFGLLVVDNLVDLEGHGLARPHVRNLAEPAICISYQHLFSVNEPQSMDPTLNGGVGHLAHD